MATEERDRHADFDKTRRRVAEDRKASTVFTVAALMIAMNPTYDEGAAIMKARAFVDAAEREKILPEHRIF